MNYTPAKHRAEGWILAGGMSRRMGSDKARLVVAGEPLLVRIAGQLSPLVEKVTILSAVGKYADLRLLSLPDLRQDQGPLAGIETALALSGTDWNLVVACDMPRLTVEWLEELLRSAATSEDDCICSATSPGTQSPLCAMWRKSALPMVSKALAEDRRRVKDVLNSVKTRLIIPQDPQILANWNEPADMSRLAGEGIAKIER